MMNIVGIINKNTVRVEELINNIGKEVRISGSIYKIRKMSDFAFVLLRTGRKVVQCIYTKENSQFSLDVMKEESCVIVTADVVEEERSKIGYELQMKKIEILSNACSITQKSL